MMSPQNCASLAFGVVLAIAAAMLCNRGICVKVGQGSFVPNPMLAGSDVEFIWKVKAYDHCDGEVIPQFIDSAEQVFEFKARPTVYHRVTDGAGEGELHVVPMGIPKGMKPGPGYYAPHVTRWRNILQKLFWRMHDDPDPIRIEIIIDPPK